MKIQIVYMSAATRPFDAEALSVLLTKARRKNEALNVSGMLLYHEGSFLQVLEGEESAVDSLYTRIAADDRHAKCVLLVRTYIDRPCFGDWSMGFVNANLLGIKSLPGYSDFFAKSFSPQSFAADPSTAQKLLLAFRGGQWRQKVEVGDNLAVVAAK